jgi:hypothetical protein
MYSIDNSVKNTAASCHNKSIHKVAQIQYEMDPLEAC